MEKELESSMHARKELEEKLSLLQAAAARQADEMESLKRMREEREREFEKQL